MFYCGGAENLFPCQKDKENRLEYNFPVNLQYWDNRFLLTAMLNFLLINPELKLYCCESLLSQPFHFPDDLAY